MEVLGAGNINGEIKIPGDKSISHRSAIISSLVKNPVRITNYLFSDDCTATLDVLRDLGVSVQEQDGGLLVRGCGISGLKEPSGILEVGNSGTAIRLISGVLAGNNFMSVISGDSSINNRPMARIIEPLNKAGATVYGRDGNSKAPIVIFGKSPLKAMKFDLGLSSAQVKSCLILAALHADGPTEINQPEVSRDHTERMLEYMGADIEYDGRNTKIDPAQTIVAKDLMIPGDLSSALFFIVGALILKNSQIIIKAVGINPTRSHILDILLSMGANIEIKNKRMLCNEPVADIEASSSDLAAATIDKDKIPNIIDEIPVLAVAAAVADGNTRIEGALELRNKESDRLKAISTQFSKAGVNILEFKDGLEIRGNRDLVISPCTLDSMGDHRIAMSLAILSLLAKEKVTILDTGCIDTSFPGFDSILGSLTNKNG